MNCAVLWASASALTIGSTEGRLQSYESVQYEREESGSRKRNRCGVQGAVNWIKCTYKERPNLVCYSAPAMLTNSRLNCGYACPFSIVVEVVLLSVLFPALGQFLCGSRRCYTETTCSQYGCVHRNISKTGSFPYAAFWACEHRGNDIPIFSDFLKCRIQSC